MTCGQLGTPIGSCRGCSARRAAAPSLSARTDAPGPVRAGLASHFPYSGSSMSNGRLELAVGAALSAMRSPHASEQAEQHALKLDLDTLVRAPAVAAAFAERSVTVGARCEPRHEATLPSRSVETERWVAVGEQQERVRIDSQAPSANSDHEIEEGPRITPRDQNREPGDHLRH